MTSHGKILFYRPLWASTIVPGIESPFVAATNAWVSAVVAAGGTVSNARKIIVNDLIVGLQTDGIFSKLDRLWLFAAENAPSALTDIIADTSASAVNTPTFTVDQGYYGNGVSAFVNCNFDPSVGGFNFTQNSAHYSLWDNSGTDTDQTAFFGGITSAACLYSANSAGVNIRYDLNNTAGSGGSFAKTGAKGLVLCNRDGANSMTFDQNGTQLDTNASASVTVTNGFGVLQYTGASFSGAPPAGHQVSSCGLGGSLNATDRVNFYNRMRTYMTAVGIP